MAERYEVVPDDLLDHLAHKVKGFKDESPKIQMGLAWMLWNSTAWRREHSESERLRSKHFFFRHQELDAFFGRAGFTAINERLPMFEVTPWSRDKGYTKAFKINPEIDGVWRQYFEKKRAANRAQIRLLYGEGYELKTLPAAVASKDMDGITARAWSRANTLGLNSVRVDVNALQDLHKWLKKKSKEIQQAEHRQGGLFSDGGSIDAIEYLLQYIEQILCVANTTVAGYGHVMHRYVEASSGRLYAKGINLQTAPKVVKEAALSGLWEYDFSNCHYAILTQMAARYGYQCTAIEDYLNNKTATRQQIAEQAGITPDQAKVCLLASLYGARQSVRVNGKGEAMDAIAKDIGVEAARRLYLVPLFAGMSGDIKKARLAILNGHPRTRKGWITNLMEKSIGGKQAAEKILAHLIQGVEAKALKTAIDSQTDSIVLLQHDGFATTQKLDAEAIERAVTEATGYTLKLEVELIQPDPDAYFSRSNIPKRQTA